MPRNPRRDTFAWHDEAILEREGVHRIALVARSLCLMAALDAIALENNDSGRFLHWGVSAVVSKLVQAGEWETVGLLLTGLETLVPQAQRDKWPLADFTEPGLNRAA